MGRAVAGQDAANQLERLQALSDSSPVATLQVVDLSKATSCLAYLLGRELRQTGGIRTMITVPMLKDGAAIGVITIFRTEVRRHGKADCAGDELRRASGDRHQVRGCSAIAAIAGQQTATADVLRVISSSPGDLEPVFRVMLENATRICEAKFGTLALCEAMRFAQSPCMGTRTMPMNVAQSSVPVAANVPVMRAVRLVQHVADMLTEQAYIDRDAAIVTMVETGGTRTFLAVPVLKDAEAVGVIIVYRRRRCAHSPTSRSRWCRTSPPRPSSPSRTRGCSTSCASAPTI